MPKYTALPLAIALVPSLAGLSAAIAEGSITTQGPDQFPFHAALVNPGGERTTRTSAASTVPKRLAPTMPRPSMSRSSSSASASRMVDMELPDVNRSPTAGSPHATDPHAPRQVGTRAVPREIRSPESPALRRSEPQQQQSRMTVLGGTRLTRASFRDWLFGR